jgi:EpsI family protein
LDTVAGAHPPIIDHAPLANLPREIDGWQAGAPRSLDPKVETVLGADHHIPLTFITPDQAAPVELFSAWYCDQTKGGIHSPEICLPGGGGEMSSIKAGDIGEALGAGQSFNITRVVITKNMNKLVVFYCFDQSSRHIASDCTATAMLVWSEITEGQTDGALVRLTNAIPSGESKETAKVRLMAFLSVSRGQLVRHVDGRVYGEAK